MVDTIGMSHGGYYRRESLGILRILLGLQCAGQHACVYRRQGGGGTCNVKLAGGLTG